MSKDKLTDYSATNSLNTDVGGVNIDEGMLPSDVNNALREVMTHLKDFAEGTQAVNNIRFAGATTTGDINFGDNDKAVFGAGSDLSIFHSGVSNVSYIQETGSGDLRVEASNIVLANTAGTKSYFNAADGGAVTLYYDNAAKLATTATGADITGTLTADGLTVDGGTTDTVTNFTSTDTSAFVRFTDGTGSTYAGTTYQNGNGAFAVYTGGDTGGAGSHKSLTIDGGGDVALYDNTGSSQGFYWDASTQRLGLGTTTPAAKFQATSSAAGGYGAIIYNTSATGEGLAVRGGSTSSQNALVVQDYNGANALLMVQGGGNVGIGTASPATKAEISSAINTTVRITSTNNFTSWSGNHFGALEFYTNDGSGAGAGIRSAIRSSATSNDGGYANLVFSNTVGAVNDVEVMRLDASGNLLVGKTASSTAVQGIEVDGANGLLVVTRDGYPTATFNRLSSDGTILDLRKDSTTVGSIGSYGGVYANIGTGNVGLMFNTGASAVIPHNMTTNAPRGSGIDLGQSGYKWKDGYFIGTVYADQFLGQNDTNTGIAVGGGDVLQLSTGGSERARVNASGAFLVGKTVDSISNTGISAAGSATGGGHLTATNSGNPPFALNRLASDGSIADFYRQGSVVGSISVTTSATTYNTTSDIRLKQDIEPIADGTDKLMAMNPVSYNWKADPDGPRSMGFIAQEMQEVMPEAVAVGDDEDAMMSMDYGRITPILVSALQDAHRKIEELAAEIAELKAK